MPNNTYYPKGLKYLVQRAEGQLSKKLPNCGKQIPFPLVSIKDKTRQERGKVQKPLIFQSEKKDGSIKGRLVYNRKSTREWMTQEDVAIPTAATESVLLTAAIDAMEQRNVIISDIPNTFIQAEMPSIENGQRKVIMKITGPLVELLIGINPHFIWSHGRYERGHQVIYIWMLRAIYGMMIATLLWYKKFKLKLERMGLSF